MYFYLFAICLVAVLAIIGASLASIQTSRRIVSTWIRVEDAVVLECKVKRQGLCSWLVIVYEYDAGDVRYMGEDAPPVPLLAGRIEQCRQRYPAGKRVIVYVDPDNHQVSTIAPHRFAQLGIFGFVTAIIGLLLTAVTAGF